MSASRPPAPSSGDGRPFLGVLFECCNIYRRLYLHRSGRMYLGQCPRCRRSVRFDVDDGQGARTRFWRAR